MLKARGLDIPFMMAGLLFYPSIVYLRQRPHIQSRTLDVLALLVIISAPVLVVTALFLFPEMTGEGSLRRAPTSGLALTLRRQP